VKEKSEGNSLKLTEGENCLRVLPDKKDILTDGRLGPKGVNHAPYREYRIHRNVGPDKAIVICGKNIEGTGACWLCDVQIPALEASGSSNKRAMAAEIAYQEQFLVQASRFDPETQKFGPPKPCWFSTGGRNSLAVRVFSKMSSSKKDYVDPVKGYNLNVERTGSGMNTRYPSVEGDESPSKVPLNVLAAVKDIDNLIGVYEEEEQKSRYFGRPKKETGDVEETEETEETTETKETEEETEETPEEEEEEEAEETEETEETESDTPEEYSAEGEEEQEEESEEEVEEEPEPEPEPEPVRPSKKKASVPPPPVRKSAPAAKPTPKSAPATTKRR
jgi:hypothetical protein